LGCSDLDKLDNRIEKLETAEPSVTSMTFLVSQNESNLVEEAKCYIWGDSVIECRIRNMMHSKVLSPHIEFTGEKAYLDGKEICDTSKVDFKKPVKLTIVKGDKTKDYSVYVYAFTGLPRVYISTENNDTIKSKEKYIKALFCLEEDVKTRGAGDVIVDSVEIKGRGNSTWGHLRNHIG
jgi:hypothetical protein